jgi:hypothetical protein
MPSTLDLTGQQFYRLTVTGLHGNNKHGSRLWDCACECGGSATVLTNDLTRRGGGTKSCGCHRRRKRPELGQAHKKAYKTRERIKIDGEWWLSLGRAARLLRMDCTTVLLWADPDGAGCPDLDGRKIRIRESLNGLGRPDTYYSESNLTEAKDARSQRISNAHYPGEIAVRELAKELGIHINTLWPKISAAGYNPVHRPIKGKDGRTTTIAHVPLEFANKMRALRRDAMPDDMVPVAEAARLLGVRKTDVKNLIAAKLLPTEPGRVIRTIKNGKCHRVAYPCRLVSREEVKRLKAALAALPAVADAPPRAGRPPNRLRLAAEALRDEGLASEALRDERQVTVGVARIAPSAESRGGDDRAPLEETEAAWPVRLVITPENPIPVVIVNPEPDRQASKANRSGRRLSEETAEVYKFCHEEYSVNGKKLSVVRLLAEKRFGHARAPKCDSDVAKYAKRHLDNLKKQ